MHSCEWLTISTLGSLWSVEIIALKLDSLSQLDLWRRRRSDHLRQILNDKTHVLIFFSQVNADEAMATSNINEGATRVVVKVAHVEVIYEVLNLIAFSSSKRRHSTTETFPTNRILTKSCEHWLLRAESDLEPTLVVLLAARELLHCLDSCSGRLSRVVSISIRTKREHRETHWRHIFGTETEPVLHGLVLRNDLAGGGVSDNSWADLLEDAVGHGVAEETANVHLVHADFGSNLGISGS